jgi:hypothetical protein
MKLIAYNPAKFFIIITLFLLTGACSDDFLETFPPDGVSINEFYQTEAEAIQAVNAC